MSGKLHITNGDGLAESIRELQLDGDILVWREMLCEGPTTYNVGSKEFVKQRQKFLKKNYKVSKEDYQSQFLQELPKLAKERPLSEIILWFEFDLFSHINMLAAISHLMENGHNTPVFLILSKKLDGEPELTPLSRLTLDQLNNHYEQRILLNQDDLEMASLMWQFYNGENPQKLKGLIKVKTNFEYLSSCLRAHIERFPNSTTGINTLEKNILKLIQNNQISSLNQLVGYTMQYQGYYGYSALQIQRIIDKLKIFYKVKEDRIVLTSKGEDVLNDSHNFYRELQNDEMLGSIHIYDYLYDSQENNILKL